MISIVINLFCISHGINLLSAGAPHMGATCSAPACRLAGCHSTLHLTEYFKEAIYRCGSLKGKDSNPVLLVIFHAFLGQIA